MFLNGIAMQSNVKFICKSPCVYLITNLKKLSENKTIFFIFYVVKNGA